MADDRSQYSPVIAEGQFGVSTIGEILNCSIGKAIVLTGSRGTRVVSESEPVDLPTLLTSLLTLGYRTYTVVDKTARMIDLQSDRMIRGDPRYTYVLTVSVTARVEDPAAYLKEFSPAASIFEAFRGELIEDIWLELNQRFPWDIGNAAAMLQEYAATIKKTQPYHKGIRIMQVLPTLTYGPGTAQHLKTLGYMENYQKYGDEYLDAESAVNPETSPRNEKFQERRRESGERGTDRKFTEFERALELARKYADASGEDIYKVVGELGLAKQLAAVVQPDKPTETAKPSPQPSLGREDINVRQIDAEKSPDKMAGDKK